MLYSEAGCCHKVSEFVSVIHKPSKRIDCKKRANGPGHAKTCLVPYAKNKGADQHAHPRSLISICVVRCLDSIICILALSKV